MLKRPLLILTLAFALGILTASQTGFSFGPLFLFTLIFLFFSIRSIQEGLSFYIYLFLFSFALGSVCLVNSKALPRCHIYNYVSGDNEKNYCLKGHIINEPDNSGPRTSFLLAAQELHAPGLSLKCCGKVLVYLKGARDLDYGQEVLVTGKLRPPFSFIHSPSSSYRNYLSNQAIFLVLRVASREGLIKLKRNRGFVLKRWALKLKAGIEEAILKHLPMPAAAVLEAMVLGERRRLPDFISRAMIKTGTVHLLVVSGFNVGIITFIILLSLKLLRLNLKLRCLATIPFLLIYCFMTGASNPVIRATVMAVMLLLAHLFKREADIYNSLALSGLFILIINPRQLFDVGFQLSFISVISIVFLYPLLRRFIRADRLNSRLVSYIIDGILVSFSAWLGTAGFIAYYFRILSPVTVLANLFMVPLASLITLTGFALVAMGWLCPGIATILASTCELAVALLLTANHLFLKIPYACISLS